MKLLVFWFRLLRIDVIFTIDLMVYSIIKNVMIYILHSRRRRPPPYRNSSHSIHNRIELVTVHFFFRCIRRYDWKNIVIISMSHYCNQTKVVELIMQPELTLCVLTIQKQMIIRMMLFRRQIIRLITLKSYHFDGKTY